MKRNLIIGLFFITTTIFGGGYTKDKPHKGDSDTAAYYEVNGYIISNTDIESELWNPRGKTRDQIVERAIFLAKQYDYKPTEGELKRRKEIRKKYEDAIVINSVMPGAVGVGGYTHKDFEKGIVRNMKAGMTLTSTSVHNIKDFNEKSIYSVTEESDKVLKELGVMKVSEGTEDIREAKEEGTMAVVYNSQGGDFLEEDLDNEIEKAHDHGVLAINIAYNKNNGLGGGGNSQNLGLTELGEEFVRKANKIGVIVDVSHSSNQAAIDAAKISTKPIIASHSNAAALHEMGRNISDEAILAVGSTGGVVVPTGVGAFLNKEGDASPEAYVKHVVYIADLIGRDKVGYSTDYVHNTQDFYELVIDKTDIYAPEKGMAGPSENLAPENIWDVAALLEDKYGWTDEEIKGFLGENLMRVYAANWNGEDEVRIQPIAHSDDHKH